MLQLETRDAIIGHFKRTGGVHIPLDENLAIVLKDSLYDLQLEWEEELDRCGSGLFGPDWQHWCHLSGSMCGERAAPAKGIAALLHVC